MPRAGGGSQPPHAASSSDWTPPYPPPFDDLDRAAVFETLTRLTTWFDGKQYMPNPNVDPRKVTDAALFYAGLLLARHHRDNWVSLLKAWAMVAAETPVEDINPVGGQ